MASGGKAHSYPTLLRNRQQHIIHVENEIVDAGIDDEAIEVQRSHVVVIGRGPTKLEVKHRVVSGHAQHRTWCDACMRTRGITGKYERWEPGREDEDPLVARDQVV